MYTLLVKDKYGNIISHEEIPPYTNKQIKLYIQQTYKTANKIELLKLTKILHNKQKETLLYEVNDLGEILPCPD